MSDGGEIGRQVDASFISTLKTEPWKTGGHLLKRRTDMRVHAHTSVGNVISV